MSRDPRTPPAVELHMAFFWLCDDCGAENYVRAVPVIPSAISDPDEREALELASDHPGQPGEWFTRPDRVGCAACGAEFDAAIPDEDEDDA